MTLRSPVSITLLALCTAPALFAQAAAPPPPPPKPGPQHEKLAYFAGTWRSEAEMLPTPMGPGGKISGTSKCDWFPGGFYLVCRANGLGPRGLTASLDLLGYSAERKRYTWYGITNSGMGGDPAYGDLVGDTWKWEGESLMGGKTVKGRYTAKQLSPDSYSWTWELSVAGGPWTMLGRGTETRVKP